MNIRITCTWRDCQQ